MKGKNRTSDLSIEGLSYLPDVVLEYNPELQNTKSFVRFAAQRCYWRLIDEYRKTHKIVRSRGIEKDLIKKISKDIQDDNIPLTEHEIAKRITDLGLNPENYLSIPFGVEKSGDFDVHEQRYLQDKSHNLSEEVDFSDFIEGMSKKADNFFVEFPGTSMQKRNRASVIRRKLVKEYIIPKIVNGRKKDLNQIAFESNITEGRLSQMLHDDIMKTFFITLYGEKDSSGKPLIKI